MAVRVHTPQRTLEGLVGPAESWGATASRLAAGLPGVPIALDLSGEVKQFALDPDVRVDLRAMTRGDLPVVARWLRAPHVRRWWHTDGEPTDEQVAATYAPRVDGTTPTRLWVAEVNGRSVGFVQDYRIRDYPDVALLTPDPAALGLDYAIGEAEWVGRGLGTRILWTWITRVVVAHPDVRSVFAAPDHGNTGSLRMLDKLGFERGTWFDERQRDGSVATVVGCSLDVRRVVA